LTGASTPMSLQASPVRKLKRRFSFLPSTTAFCFRAVAGSRLIAKPSWIRCSSARPMLLPLRRRSMRLSRALQSVCVSSSSCNYGAVRSVFRRARLSTFDSPNSVVGILPLVYLALDSRWREELVSLVCSQD